MADNVEDATQQILRRIQDSIVQSREALDRRFDEMKVRFDALEEQARRDRRNVSGLMTLLQSVSGDFDERIRDLDDRVAVVEDKVL